MRHFGAIIFMGGSLAACSLLFQYGDPGETTVTMVPCTADNAAVECNDNNPCTTDRCDLDEELCVREQVDGEVTGCDGECVDGTCTSAAGGPCNSPSECLSPTECIDGFCCASVCGDTCFACDVDGAEGTCVAIPEGADPDADCGAGQACDGAGACKRVTGQPCQSGDECVTGFCVGDADGSDKRCCDTDCGACSRCNLANTLGSCTPLPAMMPDTLCNNAAQLCDGAGSCKLMDGEACTQTNGAECLSNKCVDNYCCDDVCSGTCLICDRAGMEGTCADVPLNTDPDDECPGAANCVGGGSCG